MGYVELQKGPANKTDLDVPPAFRNDVLRSKKVLIGCGGGFHQECSQPYSPVAKWIEDADAALNDEGQQYGNLDEASAVARTPRKCIVIWCGDHKQTPGGLRKTDEAKAFRRKLLRRPIALRGDTEYLQPNMLGKVVLRYLEDVDDPVVNAIRALLVELLGEARQPPWLCCYVPDYLSRRAMLPGLLYCCGCPVACPAQREVPSFGGYPSSCSWCRW